MERPVLVLVHGAAADHTTWRVSGPMLGERFTIATLDRRGRGASGDADAHSIEREYEDVATVAALLEAELISPVVVVGHSYGGRVALGAALDTTSIHRVVCYEGAPPAPGRPLESPETVTRLDGLAADGRWEDLLVMFLSEVVGMPPAGIEAYRANPVWPARVAAARTIPREIRAAASAAADLATLARVTVPVLQLVGSASRPEFAATARGLDHRLRSGRLQVIEGAAHAAHHTHADAFVAAVTAFAG